MGHLWSLACFMTFVSVALSGCGTEPPYELAELDDGTSIVISLPRERSSDEVFPQALLEGDLKIGPTGCLGVDQAESGFVPVIFPAGTIVTGGSPLELQVRGRNYLVGDSIALSGGFTAAQPLIDKGAYPEKCAAAEVFFVAPSS